MRSKILIILFLAFAGILLYSCQQAGQLEQDMYYTNGRDLYVKRCQNCHGEHGEGLEDLIPPLTDTVFLKKNKKALACIIKNGMSGEIEVDGRKFDDKMRPNADLTDIDIAQLIVYITNTNGNKQGMYSTEAVAADLQNCK